MIFHFGFSALFNTLKLVKKYKAYKLQKFSFFSQSFEKKEITFIY